MSRILDLATVVVIAALVLFLWLVAAEPVAPPPPPLLLQASRLPILATVGDLPPPEDRLVFEITAAGRVSVGGEVLDPSGVESLLLSRADIAREREGPRMSRLHVVLRADRDLPWGRAVDLLLACAEPRVRVNRILFSAMPADGGEEGAFATFLPEESCLCGRCGERHEAPPVDVPIFLRRDPAAAARLDRDLPPFLAETWRRKGHEARGVRASVEAGSSVDLGTVLQAAEAALRAGAEGMHFRKPAEEGLGEGRRAGVAGSPTAGAVSVTVLGRLMPQVADSPVLPPAPGRVRGKFAGQCTPVRPLLQEVDVIEEEE